MRDYRPDVIIGVLRGGYIIARILADVMGINNLGVVEVKFYRGIGERAEKPIITQPLTINVQDKKVLIVDDVVDSGRTLQIVTEQVRLRGAKELKSAAIYYKPRSIIKPDYFITETSKWILFPWELCEFINEACKNKEKCNVEEVFRKNEVKVNKNVLMLIKRLIKPLQGSS